MTTQDSAPSASPSLVVLSAGLSTPSSTRMLADQLASAARTEIIAGTTADNVRVTTYELREYARDVTDAMLSRIPSPRLAALADAIRHADAVVAVTPIFNTGPSGLFKSLLDALDTEVWRGTPLVLGVTAGTARHSLAIEFAIRPIFAYLRAEVVPTAVFAASSDFGAAQADEAGEQPLAARARRAGAELAALLATRAADRARVEAVEGASPATPSPTAPAQGLDAEFADFTPMDALLHRD